MDISYIFEPLTKIGQVLGIPAVVLATWLIFSLRSLLERVQKLEDCNKTLEADLSQIKADLAFIRGKMEGKL